MIHQFVRGRWDLGLCRSSCLNYLHRLRFAFKCPKKRLTKADDAKQEAFVAEYAALLDEAGRTGGKIFFADGAHFRADAELRGKWTLKGEPPGGFNQPPSWREGQLLFGSVLGDRRSRMDGTGRE